MKIPRTTFIALLTVWALALVAGCVFGAGNPRASEAAGAGERTPSQLREQTAMPRERTLAGPAPVERSVPRQEPAPRSADPPPQPVFRPSDRRPKHDDERLARMGIRRYASRRLILYTDIAAEKAANLPPLIDQAYDAWVEYFGELPPDRERSDWQITGYLIGDRALFDRAGLIPDDLPPFINGRHRGREFWMFDQQEDYYRRHLLIHEATHCYMTTMPDIAMPLWYLEGMAELFGTHRIEADGRVRFRVMPHDRENFAGLGRIGLVQRDFARRGYRRFAELESLKPDDFLENDAYAWSWAICYFFDTHPRCARQFRELGRRLGTAPFNELLRAVFDVPSDSRQAELGRAAAEIASDWAVFAGNLEEGFDLERGATTFRPGQPLARGDVAQFSVRADRGWQSTGVLLEAGTRYEITAVGRFTLAREPRPWTSEPAGITFRYHAGRPLGELLAAVRDETPPAPHRTKGGAGVADTAFGRAADSLLEVFPIGSRATLTAPHSGTLYLRLNDSWAELADNEGTVDVTIRVADR